MNRRDFSKSSLILGLGAFSVCQSANANEQIILKNSFKEASKDLPSRTFDFIVIGAGTAGIVAALEAAKQGVSVA